MAEPLTINVQQAAKAAPAVYTVTNAVDIEPLSAFATYDGAAAASAFLPALTFYSSAGLILARVFPSTQVAAGGSADVTFAPFLGGASFALPTMHFLGAADVIVTSGTDPSGYASSWYLSWDGVTPPNSGELVWGRINIGISNLDNGGVDGVGAGLDSRGYEVRVAPAGFDAGSPNGGFGYLTNSPNPGAFPAGINIYNMFVNSQGIYNDRFTMKMTNFIDVTVGATPASVNVVKPSWPFATGTVGAPATNGYNFTYFYTQP